MQQRTDATTETRRQTPGSHRHFTPPRTPVGATDTAAARRLREQSGGTALHRQDGQPARLQPPATARSVRPDPAPGLGDPPDGPASPDLYPTQRTERRLAALPEEVRHARQRTERRAVLGPIRNRPATGIARLRRAAGDHRRHHRRGNPLGACDGQDADHRCAVHPFSYPRRAEFFSGELEQFLLQARKEGTDPLALRGSYAGAMGYGQFMPSSFTKYAVDFDGDGHIDLWNPRDAIGSVANYFKQHGWVSGDRVAVPASGRAPRWKMASRRCTRWTCSLPPDYARRVRSAATGKPACCAWTWAGTTSTGTACRTST